MTGMIVFFASVALAVSAVGASIASVPQDPFENDHVEELTCEPGEGAEAPRPLLDGVLDDRWWVTDGVVNAVLRKGNCVYIGGSFSFVGPCLPFGVLVDKTSGLPDTSIAMPDGEVYTVLSDGSGGMYIGGHFTSVGGLPRNGTAHLDADGEVTSWNPDVDGDVYSMAVDGDTIYLGGDFTHVGGQERNNVASADVGSGVVTSWNPDCGAGRVLSMIIAGNYLYLAGDFGTFYGGGLPRHGLASFNLSTGDVTSWNPDLSDPAYSMAVSGGCLYVGGMFTEVGSTPRGLIASFQLSSGALTSWNPVITGGVNSSVSTVAVSGNTVYAGGYFTTAGSLPRENIVALDATTGAPTVWNPGADGLVSEICIDGSSIYIGGEFRNTGGRARNHVAELTAAYGDATAWNPSLDGKVWVIATAWGGLFLGGEFTMVGALERNMLAALFYGTGSATSWNPDVEGYWVATLESCGNSILAGGGFSEVGGEQRNGIAAIDDSSGQVTDWYPDMDGSPWVRDILVKDGLVYICGDFEDTFFEGEERNNAVALDSVSAALAPWNPDPDNSVCTLEAKGDTIYLGGIFYTVGGVARSCFAAVDASSGAVLAMNPNVSGWVLDLACQAGVLYLGGGLYTVGGQTRNNAAAIDAETGAVLPWNPNVDNDVHAIEVSGGTVYLGGYFEHVGSQPRSRVASVDATTGALRSWNPGIDQLVDIPHVTDICISSGQVVVGGYFCGASGVFRPNVVALAADQTSIDPAEPDPVQSLRIDRLCPNPFSSSVDIEFSTAGSGPVLLSVFDLAGRCISEGWTDPVPEWSGRAVWDGRSADGESLPDGVYVLRISSGNLSAAGRVVLLR